MTKEFLHPFLGIQEQCHGKVHALRYNANPEYKPKEPLGPFEIAAAMYNGKTNSLTPKCIFGVVTLEIGDTRAEWHKVNSIKHAEQIVFQKSTNERLFDYDNLLDYIFRFDRKISNPTVGHIHWLISRANMMGAENRRGCGNIWVAQEETYHQVLDNDPRDLKLFKPLDPIGGFPCIGHGGRDSMLMTTSPDTRLDFVHQFYKGNEIDAVGYITKDADDQMWLCLPTENPMYNNERPMWHLFTKTLRFRLDKPEYALPHDIHPYCPKPKPSAFVAIKDIVGKF